MSNRESGARRYISRIRLNDMYIGPLSEMRDLGLCVEMVYTSKI